MGKLISVIIPCYNVEGWIDRCLESVTAQTIGTEKIEIICVDDCSTDSTLDRLCDWESRFPDTFIIVKSEINGRQGQARNIGLSYSCAEWVAFVDSDDWVENDYLEKLFEPLKKGDCEISCCGNIRDKSKTLTYFDKANRGSGEVHYVTVDSDDERRREILNSEVSFSAWGKIIKKAFLTDNEIFFPPHLTYEDAFWGSILKLYFKKAAIIDSFLYHYFVNASSTILKKNVNHHIDCITVQTMAWEEYERRGFIEKFRPELEIEHLYLAFLAGIKAAILRYEEPDYDYYVTLRRLVIARIPDYEANRYIKEGRMSEKHLLMLKTLKNELSKEEFVRFAEVVVKTGF